MDFSVFFCIALARVEPTLRKPNSCAVAPLQRAATGKPHSPRRRHLSALRKPLGLYIYATFSGSSPAFVIAGLFPLFARVFKFENLLTIQRAPGAWALAFRVMNIIIELKARRLRCVKSKHSRL